ncbi:MAG: 4-alpha-glucanotransferase, partial [Magnetospirillum sp.]|nr:4-alpha-glucanotransferase [Magnetospirillum sp.]
MNSVEALDRLAQLAGIEDGWWDFFGTWRPVSADTKKAFLAAMGFDVGSDEGIISSLEAMETRPWSRWLEPVIVFDESWGQPSVTFTVSAARDKQVVSWGLEEELGAVHTGTFQVDSLEWLEERWIGGQLFKRWRFRLPGLPPVGYHRLHMNAPDGASAAMDVIVAPARAYVPPAVADDHRAWGLATQVYALRTETDWGVGTYTALEELAVGAAKLGAATIGINPLHALFANEPEKFSPYAPSSRRFLNTAYVDVEAIPEFKECLEAKRMFASPGFQANLARIRGYRLVEYVDVARLQRPLLEILYSWFRKEHLAADDARGQAFL